MHPALTPVELAARKGELRAEAEKLRREFTETLAAFKPTVDVIELGVNIGRQLTGKDVAGPTLFGVGLGTIFERQLSSQNLLGRLLSHAHWLSKGWNIVQAFQHLALPSEMLASENRGTDFSKR